ncbi:hypothetical protein I307_05427 [Cryptococcus deuterogattii 99/473]|uniref:Uncharacterized protein n=1 Tax=Cryptococcus deuterogattii Ram5 TaxID=1296110 RepID=A0A0D0T4C1_9TREE|nr:hypothetical protein I309_05452 [Cryptococcus deuterogattii LA55]KIR33823.1 hypothetical protein I352_03905 [Cryptococcus deuterogattii MMRL2647]KIR40627.1 hypothetical protein I313_03278 [Cryptococcus deuterogattii Ram5]KIR74308.1 hypothetical protein I310_01910 [Cryptococcus deuterogattii CA1014]KIR94205.1 hypothetical protein I304_01842 [Cryptococcus deuterogattii CBS 10090]KIS01212.1 hypothetical protein L804_01086 [Cryptococcus deuterogattii 2001/935-1]KIY55278.1 hypothetical protein 
MPNTFQNLNLRPCSPILRTRSPHGLSLLLETSFSLGGMRCLPNLDLLGGTKRAELEKFERTCWLTDRK